MKTWPCGKSWFYNYELDFKNWITHHRTSYWAFFFIDDGLKVNPFAAQMMCCIVCYYDDNIPTQITHEDMLE